MEEINLQNVIQRDESKSDVRVDTEEIERSKATSILSTTTETDGYRQVYVANRNVAEGMMDLALLTANANQLRFLITYNSRSSTFYISMGLLILSLVLQVAVGIGLIFKRKKTKRSRMIRTNQFIVSGVFMVTFVNILVAAFTSTDSNTNAN